VRVNRTFYTTLSEYYVAGWLIKHLTAGENTSLQVQIFIRKDIFLNENFDVTGVFVDDLLLRTNPSV
jgi:hypothetical protein